MVQDVIKILISMPDTCNSASQAQEQKLGSHTITQYNYPELNTPN